jgi:hypothetical protein
MKLQGLWRLTVACGCAAFALQAQSVDSTTTEKKFSARELFYQPPTIKTVSHEVSTGPRTTMPSSTTPKASTKVRTQSGTRLPSQTRPDIVETASNQAPTDRATTLPADTKTNRTSSSPVVEATVPLGLRYSLLKRGSDSRFTEVDPEETFHSGDRMRIRVEANDTGYLYILHRGSSKMWSVMFPNPELASGDNRVERGKQYDMPYKANLVFDEQAGTEQLFVILSRKPEPDMERLIYKLSNQGKSTPVAMPSDQQSEPRTSPKLLASNVSVDDSVVSRFQQAGKVLTRDLIFEKVDDSTASADNKERAVYVVNPATNDQARLIVDVNVQHK